MKKNYENNNWIFHHCALKRGLGRIENMKLSNILYAFSTFSASTLTNGNSPDKTKKTRVLRANNRIQLPSHRDKLPWPIGGQPIQRSFSSRFNNKYIPNQWKFKLLCSL